MTRKKVFMLLLATRIVGPWAAAPASAGPPDHRSDRKEMEHERKEERKQERKGRGTSGCLVAGGVAERPSAAGVRRRGVDRGRPDGVPVRVIGTMAMSSAIR